LLQVGAIIMLIGTLPLFMYPLAPASPVAEGHVVFAAGKQTVQLAEPARYQAHGYGTRCVLEPHDALVVLQGPESRPDHHALARKKQPVGRIEVPFCPGQAEVLVQAHQVITRESLWMIIREAVGAP
jgi:hypothetical protein